MESDISIEQINTSNSAVILEKDFFEELYSSTWLKQFTIAVFFVAAFGGLILEAGIIWYEKHGNHHYRTVINQLFSTISWLVVAYICFVYMPEGARYRNILRSTLFPQEHDFKLHFAYIGWYHFPAIHFHL